MMKELLKKSLKFIFPVIFLSCSLSSPVIKEVQWDIKLVKDTKNNVVYESLSIFMNISDEDGRNDVKTIMLIDEKNQIHWELNSENWIREDKGDIWYGTNSIIMADRSPIPRSTFKLFVRDRAGESVEDKVYITKQKLDTATVKFPELEIKNRKFILKNYTQATILGFSDIGEHLYSGIITQNSSTFESIFNDRPVEAGLKYYLIVKDKDLILESGPW